MKRNLTASFVAIFVMLCICGPAAADAVSDLDLMQFVFRYAARAGKSGVEFTVEPISASGMCIIEDKCIIYYDEDSMRISSAWIKVNQDDLLGMGYFLSALEIPIIIDNMNSDNPMYAVSKMVQLISDTVSNIQSGQDFTHYDKFDYTIKQDSNDVLWMVGYAA